MNASGLTHKLPEAAIDLILTMASQDESYSKIIKEVRKQFGQTVVKSTISHHVKTNADEVRSRQLEYYNNEIFKHAIAHKGFRIRELAKIYKAAKNPFIAMRALNSVKAEMGEDVEKIVDALRNMRGGDTYVNIGIDIHQESERKRLIDESAAILGLERRRN